MYRSSIVNGQVVYYKSDNKRPDKPERPKLDITGKPSKIMGGAYSVVQIRDEQSKKDKLKNYNIIICY